jgi:hypothetical protein
MSNLIENNAYRVLGLDTTSGQKDILRRYKEIINRIKIDDFPVYDLDINLPKDYRNEEIVKNALKELQSQKDNIKEYFFWFQISNNNDKKALTYIAKTEFSKAIQSWKELAKSESVTSFFYKKNLAVLYCLLLLKEDNPKYLKDSLSAWDEIIKSEKFWAAFSKVYGDQNEQTVSQENISTFKKIVVGEISNIYTDLGQIHKDSNYVKDFQEIFGTYGESTEKNLLQPTYRAINDKIDELKKIKIVQDDPKIERKIDEIKTTIEVIKIYLDHLRKNGLYDTPESKVIRDHIAEVIREKAIADVHNNGLRYEAASELVKVAASISGTESYKTALETDTDKIKKIIEADKNTLVSIRLPGIFSKKYAEFKPRFVEYEGKQMFYKDITHISYNGIRRNYSTTYYFTIYANESQLSLTFSDEETYRKIIGLAYQMIIPVIVKRYVDRIFEKDDVITIGGVEFNKKGYTKSKFWGGIDSVSWKETIYIPKLYAGYVYLYKENEGRAKGFANIPMTTPNAVILPVLLKECVNRAFALGLIPAKIVPPPAPLIPGLQYGSGVSDKPPAGFKTWDEYYDKTEKDQQEEYDRIEKAQKPEIFKAFVKSGGEKMPKSWIEALKTIREKNIKDDTTYNIDKNILGQLIDKGYIREVKGELSTKYAIEEKGFNILNWVLTYK